MSHLSKLYAFSTFDRSNYICISDENDSSTIKTMSLKSYLPPDSELHQLTSFSRAPLYVEEEYQTNEQTHQSNFDNDNDENKSISSNYIDLTEYYYKDLKVSSSVESVCSLTSSDSELSNNGCFTPEIDDDDIWSEDEDLSDIEYNNHEKLRIVSIYPSYGASDEQLDLQTYRLSQNKSQSSDYTKQASLVTEVFEKVKELCSFL